MTLTFETKKTYSLDEFFSWLRMHGNPNARYELINGEIVEKDAGGPSGKHGEVISRLVIALGIYLQNQNNTGRIFTTAPFVLPKDEADTLQETNGNGSNKSKRTRKGNYLIPDVAFVVGERLPEKFAGSVPVMPDLVAEINSPSDDGLHIQEKIEIYKQAGVRLLWSVYMMEEFVAVYDLTQAKRIFLNPDEELIGGEVLPGFRYKVSELLK